MESADFVADSDEDEQELLEALALEEERRTRAQFEEAAVTEQHVAVPGFLSDTDDGPKETLSTLEAQRNATEEPIREQQEEEKRFKDEQESVLEVGTVVEVDSRTWPGINKLGGPGRIARVYCEQQGETIDGKAVQQVFYDVRYVLGGFERHIESQWVHSSELLKHNSNREKVDRDYYHDDFINKPHERKQREAEARRERLLTRGQDARAQAPSRPWKRKRSVRASEDNENKAQMKKQTVDKLPQERREVRESHAISLEEDSLSSDDSGAAPSPIGKQLTRRRHQILDSEEEEEESSEEEEESNKSPSVEPFTSPERDSIDLLHEESPPVAKEINSTSHKPLAKRQRYVGGYEKQGEYADVIFIQPEGNPANLPDDVVQETGLQLASTKKGLMDQLNAIFAQQETHLASFHDDQEAVNRQMTGLNDMSRAELDVLHEKICQLHQFVIKTLVHAGEDVMNKIISILHTKRGKPPEALEHFECNFDAWQSQLNECAPWVRHVQRAVENALARRERDFPHEIDHNRAREADSSEENESMDEQDAMDVEMETKSGEKQDFMDDELDLSYEYEENPSEASIQRAIPSTTKPASRPRGPKRSRMLYRQHLSRTSTLDGYVVRHNARVGWSNLRVVGSQKKTRLSDSQWNWFELIRKKKQQQQQQQRGGIQERVIHSNNGGNASNSHRSGSKWRSRDDSLSVQAQRLHLRNQRFRDQPRVRQASTAKTFLVSSRNEKLLQEAEHAGDSVISSSRFKEQSIDWTSVFEVVADDPGDDSPGPAFSSQEQAALLAFGRELDAGPLIEEDNALEDEDTMCDVICRRIARVRQRLTDLRMQESTFMNSLSRESAAFVEEYETTPRWLALLSQQEAYHSSIATLARQLVSKLETLAPSALSTYLHVIFEEFATLIRQLPDCDALFNGCQAYFFFFEVVSTNAGTTPLLTAISRTYWYVLKLLVTIQSCVARLVEKAGSTTYKAAIQALFDQLSPVKKVFLALVLFLFDLYVYLPSSHRIERGSESKHDSVLSLWLLLRSCCTSSNDLMPSNHESITTKEKQLWTLLQALYQDHVFDALARHFVRSETCGGYYQDKAMETAAWTSSNAEETFESQLLALEATWKLVVILARLFADKDKEETVYDATWAIVKDLLCPRKRNFLPFTFSQDEWLELPREYRQLADAYKQRVLGRVVLLSKLWRPCKDVLEFLMRQLAVDDLVNESTDIVELPRFLKAYLLQCQDLGNTRSTLTAFVDEMCFTSTDDATLLCKSLWIQLLKLEKRVHRNRFRRSILSAIPDTMMDNKSDNLQQNVPTKAATHWNWGLKSLPSTGTKQSGAVTPRRPRFGAQKERLSIAVLLTFAILGICSECSETGSQRSEKDVRYLEREVEFYCKEICRWTATKPACEVLASQALYVLGVLLLEKHSTEFPAVFQCLNDRLEVAMKTRVTNPDVEKIATTKAVELDRTSRRYQRATMSSLYQLRDLVKKVVEMIPKANEVCAFRLAVESSLEYVFSSGLEACLLGVVRKTVALNDLKIVIEIFHLVLPRAPDEPRHCVTSEFDDLNDEAFASFDLEGAIAGHVAPRLPVWTLKDCESKVLQLLTRKLRLAIQQLVLHYPPSNTPSFDELYAVDLLGRMLATCELAWSWTTMTPPPAGKARNLVSRVLSAAVKYNSEKNWLCNVFLSDATAVKDLAYAWLLGTLDVRALDPTPVTFQVAEVPFSIRTSRQLQRVAVASARYSDSWIMLTDEVLYQVRYHVPRGACSQLDDHLFQLLHHVATTCTFQSTVAAWKDDERWTVSNLYALHLNVFQSFCRCAGTKWRAYTRSPSQNWDEMNHFRAKMVHRQLGIFVSLIEAFKLNFRRACGELDERNHHWHSLAELFLRQTRVETREDENRSYHALDDAITSFDARLGSLMTMFRFMYQCVDAFLFHCGDMAIGDSNLFLDILELLFRQVKSAEHPHAIKRLVAQRTATSRHRRRHVHDDLRGEVFDAATVQFVDSVQLFFARQKYPSLLHWFAQTSEIYQTFKTGWQRSPLRTLLVNMVDPDGPLGIHSYYYDGSSALDVDVKRVRREVFYLACGLFKCRETTAFEHARAELSDQRSARIAHLRQFVLNEFLRETLESGHDQDGTTVLEMMVPLCQFLRGVLNHANLIVATSRHADDAADEDEEDAFKLQELVPALECIAACLIKLVPGETVAKSAIGCVLGIELGGIVCETMTFIEFRPLPESMGTLLELLVSYLETLHGGLVRRTSATMAPLFALWMSRDPPLVKLRAYRFSCPAAFRDLVVEERVVEEKSDSYGINLARATTDLLALLGRVAHKCLVSSNERVRSFTVLKS